MSAVDKAKDKAQVAKGKVKSAAGELPGTEALKPRVRPTRRAGTKAGWRKTQGSRQDLTLAGL